MTNRFRPRGLTVAEVLIASAVFLVLMTSLTVIFRAAAVQGSSRLSFEASTKNLEAHLEKLLDQARHSNVHGIAATPWGDNGMILSIQTQVGLDSLGSVSWEERLHLYWKKNGDKKLLYAEIGKEEAHSAGVELDSRYPTKPTPDQLEALAIARDNNPKILQLGFVKFWISEDWKTKPEALEILWRAENPQMPEQSYEAEAAIWLEAP